VSSSRSAAAQAVRQVGDGLPYRVTLTDVATLDLVDVGRVGGQEPAGENLG
jgi:hypothetical protein